MAYLQFLSGKDKDRRVEIDSDETLMGRSSDNEVVLDDGAVSSRHCAVVRDGQKYSLRDLGSTNGTRLNGEVAHELRIKPKDIIQVGAIELLFDGDDVEVDESVPRTEPRIDPAPTIVMSSHLAGAGGRPKGGAVSAGFGTRRNARGIWIAVGAVVAVAVGALLYLFFSAIFAG